MHEGKGLLPADILIECAAEIVCDIVLSVGKSACPAKAAHDGAAFTVDTGRDLFPVDRAVPLLQTVSGLHDRDTEITSPLFELVGRIDPARPRADDNDVIVLHIPSVSS